MATKTVTIDTTNSGSRGGEFEYIDASGQRHVVTNAETFTLTLTDGGAAAVTYNVDAGQTVKTDDGYVLTFDTQSKVTTLDIGTLADTQDATNVHNCRGEIGITCSNSGIRQNWRIAQITLDNVDAPTSITKLKLEDQFGNIMNLPSDDAGGITVA